MHDALLIGGCVTALEIEQQNGWASLLEQLSADARAARVRTQNARQSLWFAAERFHEAVALYAVEAPATVSSVIDPHTALINVLRSRLEMSGPTTATELAATLDLLQRDIEVALLALEQEGLAVRGQFLESQSTEEQWINRRLLARIHRETLKSRRSRSKAVDPSAFLRFLFDWHDLRNPQGEGRAALDQVLAQMEGWSAPTAVWEGQLLPSRMDKYLPQDLEDLCASGRYSWLRTQPPSSGRFDSQSLTQTPIALLPRRNLTYWVAAPEELSLSSNAQAVFDRLAEGGALFASDLQVDLHLLDEQMEHALAELAALGLVHSDNFLGARHIASRAKVRASREKYRRRGRAVIGIDDGGRWSVVRRVDSEQIDRWARVEIVAQALIQRYGVLFRMLLEREQGLPPWRDLLYVLRRMEARDELRGGRFVDGFAGEQFAHPEAAAALARQRREEGSERPVVVSAYDPLNLVGILTPGERVVAQANSRIAFSAGTPVASLVAGEINGLTKGTISREVRDALDPGQRFARRGFSR